MDSVGAVNTSLKQLRSNSWHLGGLETNQYFVSSDHQGESEPKMPFRRPIPLSLTSTKETKTKIMHALKSNHLPFLPSGINTPPRSIPTKHSSWIIERHPKHRLCSRISPHRSIPGLAQHAAPSYGQKRRRPERLPGASLYCDHRIELEGKRCQFRVRKPSSDDTCCGSQRD